MGCKAHSPPIRTPNKTKNEEEIVQSGHPTRPTAHKIALLMQNLNRSNFAMLLVGSSFKININQSIIRI